MAQACTRVRLVLQVMGLRFRRFDDITPAGAVVLDVRGAGPPHPVMRAGSLFSASGCFVAPFRTSVCSHCCSGVGGRARQTEARAA